MRRVRWLTDGGGAWEVDAEAPVAMDGVARPVPGDPLPLGLSRGPRATRAKQLDFLHRFMASPLVPSFSGNPSNGGSGLLLHHAHLFHLTENWSASLMEQFNIQKFLFSMKDTAACKLKKTSWPKRIMKGMIDMLTLGFGTEFLLTPNSSFLLETYNIKKGNRSKAIFCQMFPQHRLLFQSAMPGLFIDKHGTYWEVPLSLGVDLASISSDSGLSYHLCLQHNSGNPKHIGGDQTYEVPMALLPGLCARTAISIKKKVDIWRKKEGKQKMIQPYDLFISEPHVSASGIIGAVASLSLGENSARLLKSDEIEHSRPLSFYAQKDNIAAVADIFASVSCTAQHGNFQRFFSDLTRLNARLDFPSASAFVKGASLLAKDLYNSEQPDPQAIRAICPDLHLSLQQQIVGPFSFRIESKIGFDPKNGRHLPCIDESVYAIDWALKVLGSAKATAWYSPKHQEAMVELRFFES